MSVESRYIAFLGHHKCGTMWINSIFHSFLNNSMFDVANYYDSGTFQNGILPELNKAKVQAFSYTNACFNYIEPIIEKIIAFHVIRDPRDICVSAYFSHRNSHSTDVWPELVQYRRELVGLSKEYGLLREFEFSQQFLNSISEWNYSCENIYELKFEELIERPYETFIAIFKFLNLIQEDKKITNKILINAPRFLKSKTKLNAKELLGIVYENRFSKKTGNRQRGIENSSHHYRKGIAGDWKNHFSKKHKELFKELYGDLLIKLKYENDYDW